MNNNNSVNAGNTNPLITFALFAFNQEKYVREAVEGALSQTYSPLEIILSDDCSIDKTFEIMEEMVKDYNGPHVIKLNRNLANLGLIDHVNLMFEISSGDLIVAAAGDDISAPERTQCLVDIYEQSQKKAMLIHSSVMQINEGGAKIGMRRPPIIEQPIKPDEIGDCVSLYIGGTGAWNRTLYEDFGTILFRNGYEDLVLGFRAEIRSLMYYVDKPLIRYRVGCGISAKKPLKSAMFMSFFNGIELRINFLTVALDVFEQRLLDLEHIKDSSLTHEIRRRLENNILHCKYKLMLFNHPLTLLVNLFSKDSLLILRALWMKRRG